MRLLKKCKTLRAALGGRLDRMGRRGRWELSVLLGLALALTLAGGAALAWMWRALERYEAATPEASILSCIRAVQAGGEAPEPPYELLPGRFGSEKDYWAAAEKQLAALPASRDELRFFRTAQGEAVRYTVTAQEGQKAEFLLYPQQGGWRAWPIVPALPDYSFTAPATARLWVNGVPLSDAEKVGGAASGLIDTIKSARPLLGSGAPGAEDEG